jgi:osmotically-inducible protein OsmY
MPEEAYRRHPEYRQERQPREWEAHQHEYGAEELSDDEVRDAVYRRMLADAWVDPERIDVQVEDGVVTLTGEVDDFMEARYAWDDAWETDGVRGVVNNLTVRADQPHDTHGDVVVQGAGDRTTAEDEPPA